MIVAGLLGELGASLAGDSVPQAAESTRPAGTEAASVSVRWGSGSRRPGELSTISSHDNPKRVVVAPEAHHSRFSLSYVCKTPVLNGCP
jgi:hypothetical protein